MNIFENISKEVFIRMYNIYLKTQRKQLTPYWIERNISFGRGFWFFFPRPSPSMAMGYFDGRRVRFGDWDAPFTLPEYRLKPKEKAINSRLLRV